MNQGELLASLVLADPTKVMRLRPFEGSLDLSPPPSPREIDPQMAAEAEAAAAAPVTPAELAADAAKRLSLLLDGYIQQQTVHQLMEALLRGPCGSSVESLVSFAKRSLHQFLSTEELFAGKGHADAAAAVVAASPDLPGRLRLYISHYAVKQKAELILSILKELSVRPTTPPTCIRGPFKGALLGGPHLLRGGLGYCDRLSLLEVVLSPLPEEVSSASLNILFAAAACCCLLLLAAAAAEEICGCRGLQLRYSRAAVSPSSDVCHEGDGVQRGVSRFPALA